MTSVIAAGGGESIKSGPMGLAIILVLCVGCYFLFKSMSKHLRKVREEFPGAPAPTGESPSRAPGSDAPDSGAPATAVSAEHDSVADDVEKPHRSVGPPDIPS